MALICSSEDVLIAMFAKNHPHKLKCESFELNKHVPVSVMNYINIIFKDAAKDKSIITPCQLNLIYNYNLSDVPFQLMMLPR